MGKKARKTRWRTLSIGEGTSDTESQAGDGVKPHAIRSRWGQEGRAPGAHQRYNSSHSTPTRHHNHRHYHGGDSTTKWTSGGRALHHADSTRSSSTASDTKITFNEDEYTKITTPRQDVLFKKGYLSKPKPHLQRPLTSAGNSTGDGTPDHQSADGADYPENDFDTVFPYPPTVGGPYDPSVYYLNGYDNVAGTQPVLLYDQFGNAALCYPQGPALHHYQTPHTNNIRAKRYSVDSEMTESASPNNESNENENEVEVVFPEQEEEEFDSIEGESTSSDVNEEDEEKKMRKKRRRRKSEKSEPEETKTKYSVDAEEFVPRGFAPPPPISFMLPPDMFPGAFVFVGPPVPAPFYSTMPLPLTEDCPLQEPPVEPQDEAEEDVVPTQGPIDIAKIVSKLEQAALEQKLQEQEENKEIEESVVEAEVGTTEPEVVKEEVKVVEEERKVEKVIEQQKMEENKEKISKTDISKPAAARYSDRLKTHQQAPKPSHKHLLGATVPSPPPQPPQLQKQSTVASNHRTNKSTRLSATSTAPVTPCPRLERAAAARVAPSGPTTPPAAPTDWISVSGKKKRNKNKLPASTEVQVTLETAIESQREPTPPVSFPTPLKTAEKIQEAVVLQTPASTAEKVKKEKDKTKTGKINNKVKKRIIINDGALASPVETSQSVTSISVPSLERATNSDEEKVPKKEKQIQEEVEVLTLPEVSVSVSAVCSTPEVLKQTEQTLQTCEPKKSKKKKTKSKSVSTDLLNTSSMEESQVSEEVFGTHQDDDVSLELERMIQRGLYANLEQRLQNHNPGDSFLTTMQGSTPGGSLFTCKKPPLLPFPPIILSPVTENLTIVNKHSPSPPRECPAALGPSGGGSHGLSITQAVREWMDRTRETTPEVEIFRKPEDLRQEVLSRVLEDIGDSADEEAEEPVSPTDEQEVDHSAREALAEPRSRSASVDLLQCWDYDEVSHTAVDAAAPLSDISIDTAEDALESCEHYESVYGRSGDFQRIQSEVLGLRPRPRTRGDGGLPYRAICCTVM